VTIHSSHPFEPDQAGREPIRRFRGRVGGAVSLWTAGQGMDRAGLTVTSMLVAAGDPARVVVLLHPDADLLERIEETSAAVVSLLTWRHRELADMFAGQFPAPGSTTSAYTPAHCSGLRVTSRVHSPRRTTEPTSEASTSGATSRTMLALGWVSTYSSAETMWTACFFARLPSGPVGVISTASSSWAGDSASG